MVEKSAVSLSYINKLKYNSFVNKSHRTSVQIVIQNQAQLFVTDILFLKYHIQKGHALALLMVAYINIIGNIHLQYVLYKVLCYSKLIVYSCMSASLSTYAII